MPKLVDCISDQEKTRCVCETQMPLVMANFTDGQGHKGKYQYKDLVKEMLMFNMKARIFIFFYK